MGDGGPHEPPIVVPLANGTRKLPLKYAPTANGWVSFWEQVLASCIAATSSRTADVAPEQIFRV